MTKQSDTTVALVGANGQVGTELSFLLRANGFDIVPVVRNKIGAATFDRYGFDYRIGEITNDEHAQRLLGNVDATVVLAHVPWFYGDLPRTAKKTNSRIVQNSIRFSPDTCKVLFFSTLVSFGDEIGLSDWSFYGREKRNLEKKAKGWFKQHDREGYIFRLGHVYGPTQDHTLELVRSLADQPEARLPVSADKPSNVVHTVTVAEALGRAVRGEVEGGTYSVVNRPQWTWSDVIEYYLPGNDFIFVDAAEDPSTEMGVTNKTIRQLLITFSPYQNHLLTLLGYLPNRLSSYVLNREISNQVVSSIERYQDRRRYDNNHFEYEPVPGPYIEVPPATELLEQEEIIEHTFGNDAKY